MVKLNQSICYSHHTKDSTTQSMRTRGAAHSYTVLAEFISKIGEGVVINDTSVMAGFWEKSKIGKNTAKTLVEKLENLYGKQAEAKVRHAFSFSRDYEAYLNWSIPNSELADTLEFVDSLGGLPELEYRPPVSVVVHIEFYLKYPSIAKDDKAQASSIAAFLSPNSNSIGLHIVFPFADPSKEFEKYKQTLASLSPIPLLDKYYYVRKINKNDEEYYRRLYPTNT